MGHTTEIIHKLRSDILRLEHFCSVPEENLHMEWGAIKQSFPNGTFPLAAIHEFMAATPEETTSSAAFITALSTMLLKENGMALWVNTSSSIFPPALQTMGIAPDRFIFLQVKNNKEVLWVLEEALKCAALTIVIGEVHQLDFNESRKLQLAVEESKVTGFIIRQSKHTTTTASASRWKISSLPSDLINGLPGIGFPKWKVELLRVRNGKPGSWQMQWHKGKFIPPDKLPVRELQTHQQTG